MLPRSLAGRTALVLVAGLIAVQGAGLLLYGRDRLALQRLADARDLGNRVVPLYRTMVMQPDAWTAELREVGPTVQASIETRPVLDEFPPAPPDVQRLIRPYLGPLGVPPALRPRIIMVRGQFERGSTLLIGMQAPDDRWLVIRTAPPAVYPWLSSQFRISLLLMTLVAAGLSLWAVRRLTAPLRVLAQAAERLGRDVNAPPLPEEGPAEVVTAAAAFNTMADRLRRFVADRTLLLTAIGHDLRTPITRLKLRAEWMEDDEQRRKMLADLDELEAMVASTLAFGHDVAGSEPAGPVDLAALLRTVLDEAADARPASAELLSYAGPQHLAIAARPVALKRAMANLIGNALAYGGAAHVKLETPSAGQVAIRVEDAGPGIPPAELERVFEPFRRLETSRNRETGGTGLGLSITRNILRAHGGDVSLANRLEGGVRATVTLPVG
ncbi:MAG: hypothetical protein NVSMB18_08010 [Acetobacteraceae bacterium]